MLKIWLKKVAEQNYKLLVCQERDLLKGHCSVNIVSLSDPFLYGKRDNT